MIDFDISPEAVRVATNRVKLNRILEAQIQICLDGLVCPKCAGILEKRADYTYSDNIIYICLNSSCDFTWPPAPEKLKTYIKE